jgi:hypothetical protein
MMTFADLFAYVGLVLLGILVWAAMAPLETLGWWAGWFGDRIYHDELPSDGPVRLVRPNVNSYILFLSGVGRVSGETISRREREFLRRLAGALPQTVVIDDIFPYSVNNLALTGQPFFARIWRWAFRRKLHGPQLAGYLINLRNIWQVMISADKRYGPIFNQAVAQVFLHALTRYNYDPTGQTPVYVIGYSGGGQMAVGAAGYLCEWIRGPVYVISLGGVFGSEPSLLQVRHLYHLYGTSDRSHKLGLIAPGRWPIFPASPWNRARRQGLITEREIGPMGHTGRRGYLDANHGFANGVAYVDHTVAEIAKIVSETATQPAPTPQPAPAPARPAANHPFGPRNVNQLT